ncbi:MAG TPA: ABC transporter permease [Bryobacteraceae bacterium]|nr:ABC transporter permease [Bryobacteraceae bacterium]
MIVRLRRFISRLRLSRLEHELREEMHLHIDLRAAALRKKGMSAEEAKAAARRSFGNVLLLGEESREMWGWNILDTIVQDLRYAFRQFRKAPVFTAVGVATLALGIGANTAVFSVVNQILLHPAGIKDPDGLVAIREKFDRLNLKSINVSPPVFADARDSRQIFEHTAVARATGFNYSFQSVPERLEASAVSAEWFDVFGAKPLLGRVFLPEEDQPNANHVVVLSHAAWTRVFGADSSILGHSIELNQETYRIVGVMSPDFRWPHSAELWVPIGLPPQQFSPRNRFNESLDAVARLKPGVSFAQANAWLKVLTDRVWNAGTPGSRVAKNGGWGMFAVPYVDLISEDTRRPALVLFGAVGALLLIACANIAGLTLARTSARSVEMGLRAALGAGHARLRQQVISECILLSIAGAATGVALAYAGISFLLKIAPEGATAGIGAHIDLYVLLFTGATAIASGVLFGLAPALRASKAEANSVLKGSARLATAGPARQRLRSALVTLEAGLALVLLVSAALFLRSFALLQNVNPGFDAHGVMTAMFSLPAKQYPDPAKQAVFYRSVLENLSKATGVSSAAIGLGVPFTPYGENGSFLIEGRTVAPGEPNPQSARHFVTPGYFKSLSIPVRRGRAFAETDRAESEPVALIDENLARQYWPNEDPLAKRIQLTNGPTVYAIVGIVGHVNNSDLAMDNRKGEIYLDLFQFKQAMPVSWIIVKTRGDVANMAAAIRSAVREADPKEPVRALKPLRELVSDSLAPRTFVSSLLGLFAALALAMAMLGLYGVINYSVTERTREIGIRIALGGSRWSVLQSVLGEGLRLAVLGTALGLAGSLAVQRVLQNELYEVKAFDPLLFTEMAAALLTTSLVASYLPARRAVRVDPLTALRYE